MKDYKVGYILPDDLNKTDEYGHTVEQLISCYNQFINYLIDIVNKHNLGLNIKVIENYTKEECDLVIYEQQSYLIYDKLYDRSAFENAKGNPKFLMYFFGEPHNFPYWFDGRYMIKEDNYIIRSFNEFVPFCSKYKCYAISMYEDTLHNCCMPYILWSPDTFNNVDHKNIILNNKKTYKNNFCSMVFWHGTREREILYNILSEYKKIDCYGEFHKNQYEKDYYSDEDLNSIMPQYKFNICFENTHSDYNEAYITEKIVKAFNWGTVPIYWGNNKQIYDIFKRNSFINLTDISYDYWLDIIKEYDTNDNLYYNALNTYPILDDDISNKYLTKKNNFIINILTKEY